MQEIQFVEGTLSNLVDDARRTLVDGLRLLESVDDQSYSARPETLATDSAGSHVRHCVEFFDCFLDGLDRQGVDYAARKRDQAIAHDRLLGRLKIAEVIDRLQALDGRSGQDRILIRAEDAEEACWTTSTVGRELEFLRSHTVHHYALIAIILRSHSLAVPATFGVAPSTLQFQAETVCAETVCAQ